MENKELVKELVKLQTLCKRYVERNTNLRISTFRDFDRLLMNNKMCCTYEYAVKTLKNNIEKYCNKCEYICIGIKKLHKTINNSSLKDLKLGFEGQRKFTEEENKLDNYRMKCQMYYTGEMVSIKEMSKLLNVTDSAIKQACQQERLLNTRKVGNGWQVHIQECRTYWNIKDINESHLYKDWVY